MTNPRPALLAWAPIGILFLANAVSLGAILFKGAQPVKIGLGTLEGGTIRWTDCSGKHPESFQSPPYTLDLADNCTVGPPAFGLECQGESCRVVDPSRLEKYVTGFKKGDSIQFRIQDRSVTLTGGGHVLTIDR